MDVFNVSYQISVHIHVGLADSHIEFASSEEGMEVDVRLLIPNKGNVYIVVFRNPHFDVEVVSVRKINNIINLTVKICLIPPYLELTLDHIRTFHTRWVYR